MARKSLTVKITTEGRDNGKTFLIREFPASKAEKWAIRAILSMGRTGVDLPVGLEQAGMAGIARVGIEMLFKLPFDDAEPLLNELFECVSFIPNPSNPEVTRNLIEDDIEEVATRIKLRIDAFNLHINFSQAASQ